MARWTLYLSKFDIKLVHILGEKNIQADALSRRPDLCPEGTNNENVVVLPEHLFVTFGSEWVRTSENEFGVSRDLASAYVLCLHTFVVPNLRRDEGKSLGKKD